MKTNSSREKKQRNIIQYKKENTCVLFSGAIIAQLTSERFIFSSPLQRLKDEV
jgi:hypothetical protein